MAIDVLEKAIERQAEADEYDHETRGMTAIEIKTSYSSTWLDNTKAKFVLNWQPAFDLKRLIEEAWSYHRSASDPRRVFYPG